METLTEIAQRSLEGLVRGESVPKDDSDRLADDKRRFVIEQAGRLGTFDVSQIDILLGAACPGVYVDVRADTDKGPENFRLGLTPEGGPDFAVHCLGEVPEAAGPI